MNIRHEVLTFIGIVAALGVCAGLLLNALMLGISLFLSGTAYLLLFFRDLKK